MSMGQSDRVRQIVEMEYVTKARKAGKKRFSVRAGDVLRKAEESPDFPRARTPLICNVLQSKKLLNANNLEIESIDGPPSRQSRTVVVHYRVLADSPVRQALGTVAEGRQETSEEKAVRLTEKLRGLLKDELAAYGGGEAFLKWVRSEEDEAA